MSKVINFVCYDCNVVQNKFQANNSICLSLVADDTKAKREKDGAGVLPVALNKKLNTLLEVAGIKGCSASSFRDSGIKMFYDNGARYNDLRDFTGIKTKKSLDGKIRPHEAELTSIMDKVFRNI